MKPWFKLLSVFLLCGAIAHGRPKAKPKAARRPAWGVSTTAPRDPNSARRVATQKFSGLKLKGQLKKPDLSYIYKRKGLRADQVVDVPEDFNREIIDSALSF